MPDARRRAEESTSEHFRTTTCGAAIAAPSCFHMNLLSLLVGLLALLLAVPAFLPLLGWLNWFVVPLAMIGLALGAISRGRSGRNLNLVVIVIAVIRLVIGHGLL